LDAERDARLKIAVWLLVLIGIPFVVALAASEIHGASPHFARHLTSIIAKALPPQDRELIEDQWYDDLRVRKEKGLRVSLLVVTLGFLLSTVIIHLDGWHSRVADRRHRRQAILSSDDQLSRLYRKFEIAGAFVKIALGLAGLVVVALIGLGVVPPSKVSPLLSGNMAVIASGMLGLLILRMVKDRRISQMMEGRQTLSTVMQTLPQTRPGDT
jgi:hypothetical protein